MAEYIEREALLEKLSEAFFKTNPDGEEQIGVLKCSRIVREFLAADVVEVVRCRDCVNCKQCYPAKAIDEEPIEGWKCELYGRYVKPDGFCSYGERRTENDL